MHAAAMYIGSGATVYMASTTIWEAIRARAAAAAAGTVAATAELGRWALEASAWNGTLKYDSGTVTLSGNAGGGGSGGGSNGSPGSTRCGTADIDSDTPRDRLDR